MWHRALVEHLGAEDGKAWSGAMMRPSAPLSAAIIRHTVVFRLKHPLNSAAERAFLQAACALAQLPGVERFECLRQVGTKNAFTFGLSMEFADAEAYSGYNDHPEHTKFVQERWLPEVAEFLEIDYAPWSADALA